MNFDWMSFNFEDVTHDLFSHFPSKSFKAWTQKSRSEFFFCFAFTCDTSGIYLFSVIQGLLSTLQSGARLNSYKDYLLEQESRLSAVGGLTINWGTETEM